MLWQGECAMQGCIFDLDGTLLDTLADIAGACNAILAAHGQPVHTMAAYRQMVGSGFPVLIRRAWPPEVLARLSPAEQEGVLAETRAWYAAHLHDHTRPYPNMVQTLHRLAACGVRLAVLSNKPEELTRPLVEYFFPDIPFVAVHGGCAARPLKPDPAAAAGVLAALGLSAENCYYVGDSDVDMYTAHNCGMNAVGAAWGFRGPEELRAAKAHHIVNCPEDLLALPYAVGSQGYETRM